MPAPHRLRAPDGAAALARKVKRRPVKPKTAKAAKAHPWRRRDGGIHKRGLLIGYARVSTLDQNLALQQDALTSAGCEKIFTEQMSGAVADRPILHEALDYAHRRGFRRGDGAGREAAQRHCRGQAEVRRTRRHGAKGNGPPSESANP
jgi:hypothetical protein